MRNAAVLALAAFAAGIWTAPGEAQEFPSHGVRIVVPAAGGSTTDAVARLLADELSRKWGKSVIVENIAGGAMNIGATSVARSAPDGHTLMVAPPAPLSFNDLLYKDLNYVPTAFVPITLLATVPNVLDLNKDLPINSIKELIAYGKANRGKLSYGSQGAGSTAHLTASQIEVLGGIKMVHVPYRGAQ